MNANIVSILGCGHFPQTPFYFIDMEYCDFNLDTYIYSKWDKSAIDTKQLGHFVDFDLLNPDQKLGGLLTIMRDIANGVACLHRHRQVHRDLKPRNSKCLLEMKSLM